MIDLLRSRAWAIVAALASTLPGCGPAATPPPALPAQELVMNQMPKGPSGVPLFHEVPDFALVGDDGGPVGKRGLLGQVWVASFLFTSCGDTCPAMVGKIQVLQHTLPEGAVLISFSVDPERDTPEKLQEYAAFNHRLEGKWRLVTGPWEAISELAMKGFYLGGGKRQLHSPRFGLVDKAGRLRGYYDSREQEQMAKLVRDVSLLLTEAVEPAAAVDTPGAPSALDVPQVPEPTAAAPARP